MLSAIAFGLFAIVSESKAQDKTVQTTVKQEDISPSEEKMSEGYFSCKSSFYDNNEMIAYSVKFKNDGVSVNVELLKLDSSTGKFNAGFVKGVFLSDKVVASVPREWITKQLLTYEAKDSIVRLDDRMILYGEAKMFSRKNESIEANRIVIIYE